MRRILLLSAVALMRLFLAPSSALAQTFSAPPPTTKTTVNNGASYQTDPHVSGNLVAYVSDANGSTEVRYHDLVAGTDWPIPNGGGFDQFLPDVHGTRIVFTRVGTNSAIYTFDAATAAAPVELAPSATSNRRSARIGGATVAWQDFGFHASAAMPEIVVHDLPTGTTTRLTNDQLLDWAPAVSPNGHVVVWTKCQTNGTGCDVWKAVRSAGVWTAAAVTGASAEERLPDTNGQEIVYVSALVGSSSDRNICSQPVAGGTEQCLMLAGPQSNPRVSGSLVSFEHFDAAAANWDLGLYNLANGSVHRLTQTAENETLADISVAGGAAHVVYATDGPAGDSDVYALTFSISALVPPVVHVVDSAADGGDINLADGQCDDGTGKCTLRAAIEQGNASPGWAKIHFSLPPFCPPFVGQCQSALPQEIAPASPLPIVTDPATIDGTTQPGFAGWPIVVLIGTDAGPTADGLRIRAGFGSVRGVQIIGFGHDGIVLSNTGHNAVQGNFIVGNGSTGVRVTSPNNLIGGGTSAARNVISANGHYGVALLGATAVSNLVAGNLIGTDASGTAAQSNGLDGVALAVGASGNTIGAGNVISGNTGHGVGLYGGTALNLVRGNYVGTDLAGTSPLGNGGDGVFLNVSSGNTIGGAAAGAGNVISGNTGHGIHLSADTTATLIEGNRIGTDAAGAIALANGKHGIFVNGVASSTGKNTVARNVVSGNGGDGVRIDGGSGQNLLRGNFVGTNSGGLDPLGNGGHGLHVNGSSGNTIGGSTAGNGNTVAFNGGDGIFVAAGTGNALRGNTIHSNGGLGIDLGPDGVTPNDAGDADPGANNLQNFPLLTSALIGSDLTVVKGTLSGTANMIFSVELFANAPPLLQQGPHAPQGCDPSGSGEGRRFLAERSVKTDANGQASFSATLSGQAPVGLALTANATDPQGNTSEFSPCVLVQSGPDLAVTKAGSPDPVTVNGVLTYTVTVTNNGPSVATGVTVVDPIPPGAILGWVAPSQGTCASGGATSYNLVVNGDFETPSLSGSVGSKPYSAGQTLGSWTVASGSVDHVAPYPGGDWQAASGQQSVDLTGTPGAGAISQTLSTTPGAGYLLRFAMAGNPVGSPALKEMRVRWGSTNVAELQFDTTGHTRSNMGWLYHDVPLVATANSTTLTFESLIAGYYGPALDDVSVVPAVVCNLGTLVAGASATVTIVVIPTTPGTLTNTASAGAVEPDLDPTNNRATATTEVWSEEPLIWRGWER